MTAWPLSAEMATVGSQARAGVPNRVGLAAGEKWLEGRADGTYGGWDVGEQGITDAGSGVVWT